MNDNTLHPSIVAMVSLAANIAANHPKNGLCQVDKLKQMGVSQQHIDAVVEIARHLRNEAGEIMDYSFDQSIKNKQADEQIPAEACCATTASGQACC